VAAGEGALTTWRIPVAADKMEVLDESPVGPHRLGPYAGPPARDRRDSPQGRACGASGRTRRGSTTGRSRRPPSKSCRATNRHSAAGGGERFEEVAGIDRTRRVAFAGEGGRRWGRPRSRRRSSA
jgi:hypothetical protein